jgi:hypothetical protein
MSVVVEVVRWFGSGPRSYSRTARHFDGIFAGVRWQKLPIFLPSAKPLPPHFATIQQAQESHWGEAMEEYVTVAELAERLKLSKKSIRNKIAAGDFRMGVHYFRPKGMAPRFKWSAIVAWVEDGAIQIPMARGYALRQTLDNGDPIDTILPRPEHIKRASGKSK